MPTITFNGLPIGSWVTIDGLAQNLLLVAWVYLSIKVILARRRAVVIAKELKKNEDRWKKDSRFDIPCIGFVDPAISLLWGKTEDLPVALKSAILRWRTLSNRAFLLGIAFAALSIWRH